MNVRPAEYGERGVLAIGAPQANPTAEPELWALRPAGTSLVTARLCSNSDEPRRRLADYLDDLGDTLMQFARLQIDAFGFACTGSTYLRGHAAERAKIAELETRFGHPVITAAAAIEAELRALDAQRIAIVAPYPAWLNELGLRYWRDRGFKVVTFGRVALPSPDTTNIYALRSTDALRVLSDLKLADAQAVLFSGTGMPSLRALVPASKLTGLPVLSSNLCLARALAAAVGLKTEETPAKLQDRIRNL